MATTPENHQPASAAGNEATQPNTYRAAPAPTMPQAQPAQQAPAQQAPAQQTPLTQTPAPVADQLTTPLPHLAAASQGGAYPQPVQTAQPTTQYPQPAPHSYPAPAPQHQYPQAPVQAQAPVQTQAPMLSHGQAKPQQSQLGLGAFGLGVNDGHGNLSGHGGQGGEVATTVTVAARAIRAARIRHSPRAAPACCSQVSPSVRCWAASWAVASQPLSRRTPASSPSRRARPDH
ncbi:pyruvate/2-oxoglutarate dehydrogenase complex dihydrolipoamide acyltransferase (E2) component [Leucobacter exalbidus]|uniref:Pyruvate/2-oxoglutarate dehydrogenase complex dihydrolipoamide acyltransferase (E2) component n=1 Tax=Leucobacter exalbidus TaxID=662960 RepID=A0A940PT93_9MICO|nr:hypothetical protein [Leucobacter exalbidus]MBP1324834.1 pyruvate/2-oxoglutarate dehydrogenase complex dihydrolipoamide acyltransferase (E2) component [Leucobacter exalbidus]